MTLLGNLMRLAIAIVAMGFAVAGWAQPKPPVDFDLPAQPLETSLRQIADAQKLQIAYVRSDLAGIQARPLKARLTAKEAIERLLEGTGLVASFNGEGVVVKKAGASPTTSAGEASIAGASGSPSVPARSAVAMPQIMVEGARELNMDIERTRDDAQPYVVFDRETIERSGATNVEDFLKQRLTMNTQAATASQSTTGNITGNSSAINLRGLGTNQTLILIDGHRIADFSIGNVVQQSTINGIPLAAIERIEVLPTTAGGIYGGSATGGVVNIILRREYSGTEARVTYDNSFNTDSANRRVDVSSGFTLESGKTRVLIAGSYLDANRMLVRDRDFARQGRANIISNNPNFYLAASTPPMGATTNITSVNGSNLVLNNGSALNSPRTHVPVGYLGPASDNGAGLIANAGLYNMVLADSAQVFHDSAGRTLLNGPSLTSMMATVRREFTPDLHAFLDAGGSNNIGRSTTNTLFTSFTLPANAPGNPFQQAIRVTVPVGAGDGESTSTTRDRRVVAGVIAKLPRRWQVETDYTWQRYSFGYTQPPLTPAAVATAVTNGTLNVFRDTQTYPLDLSSYLPPNDFQPLSDSTLKDVTIRLGGPMGSFPGGAVQIVGLLERRDIEIEKAFSIASPNINYFPSRAQVVKSAYVEARFPLISDQNKMAAFEKLDLQIAGRRDEYTTRTSGINVFLPIGTPRPADTPATNQVSSSNPTVALSYQPVGDVNFRVSWGTGFLPPVADQLLTRTGNTVTITDPRRGNASYPVTGGVIAGGNPNLKPENSESWSAGAILTPRFAPQLRLSLDFTRIKKTDNILAPTGQQIIDNEALLGADRIGRGSNLPGDQPGWAGPVTFLDITAINISRAQVDAYDVQLDYHYRNPAFGSLNVFGLATWVKRYTTQLLPTAGVLENVGVTRNNPLKVKASAGLTWSLRQWTAGWTARYFHSYYVANPSAPASTPTFLNQGGQFVKRQIYHDAFVSYRFPAASDSAGIRRLFSNMEVDLGLRNVFNTKPPYDASAFPYYSAFGDPRLASYYLSLKWKF